MNTTATTPTPAAAPATLWAPIVIILSLALKLRARFVEVRQSTTLLVEKAREHITWQTRVSEEVRAIDDPLERNMDFFEELFANDPPAKRAKARALFAQVHRGTELESAKLNPRCPTQLLHD